VADTDLNGLDWDAVPNASIFRLVLPFSGRTASIC
jgi:hypothetical protein